MGSIEGRGRIIVELASEADKEILICDDVYIGENGELQIERWTASNNRQLEAFYIYAPGKWLSVHWEPAPV